MHSLLMHVCICMCTAKSCWVPGCTHCQAAHIARLHTLPGSQLWHHSAYLEQLLHSSTYVHVPCWLIHLPAAGQRLERRLLDLGGCCSYRFTQPCLFMFEVLDNPSTRLDVQQAQRVQPLAAIGQDLVVKAVWSPRIGEKHQRHRLRFNMQVEVCCALRFTSCSLIDEDHCRACCCHAHTRPWQRGDSQQQKGRLPLSTRKMFTAIQNAHLSKSVELQTNSTNGVDDGSVVNHLDLDAQLNRSLLQIAVCCRPEMEHVQKRNTQAFTLLVNVQWPRTQRDPQRPKTTHLRYQPQPRWYPLPEWLGVS